MQRPLTSFALLLLMQCASGQSAKIETTFTNSLEMPFVRVASIGGALVCRYETRVRDYQPFATATNVEWRKPEFPQTADHPAINVSYTEALAFCEWLGKKEGRKYRLLTDQEWSVLAGLKEDAKIAPKEQPPSTGVHHWGKGPLSKEVGNFCDEAFGKKYRNSYDAKWLEMDDGHAHTAPVGSYPADVNGLYDFAGNVWEWVDGWYDPPNNTLRIVRGGSFRAGSEKRLMASFRGPDPHNVHLDSVGFRIVCEKE
ncbi:MAG: SUMF1/EgtB/PvdO family nonheme iron enzyme [Verrucomicrobia bacterium]|nr:SUMF1/EgtB/PvdO family nonheme iron enzyme [Verrucomicrobiota bacterium]